jgi:hypothetical protein
MGPLHLIAGAEVAGYMAGPDDRERHAPSGVLLAYAGQLTDQSDT